MADGILPDRESIPKPTLRPVGRLSFPMTGFLTHDEAMPTASRAGVMAEARWPND
jgi:hypothetical protein